MNAADHPTDLAPATTVLGPPLVLQAIPLFAGLSDAECAALDRRMRRVDFIPQTVIVREGSADESAFFVVSGCVAVRRTDAASGIEFTLAELGPGQVFGEMALLTKKPRTATVVALEATTCAVLGQTQFEQVLREHPALTRSIMTMLAGRLDLANAHAGIDFLNLSRIRVDPRVLQLLPLPVINQHRIIPLAFCNNRLTLAMTNPNNIVAFDDVRRLLKGVMIEPAVITEDDFRRFMTGSYPQARPARTEPGRPSADRVAKPLNSTRPPAEPEPAVTQATQPDALSTVDLLQSDLIRELQLTAGAEVVETKQDLMSASEDAPIIRLANSILGLAIRRGASDIHVEPMEQDVTVRFRVDGVLQIVERLPRKVQLGLISRLKIISRLDISEKRLPQDGRISVTMDGKPIDFRVSTVPGKWGEKVCMRILDKSNTNIGLDRLITHAPTLAEVRELAAQPHGIIYVTGPTGSGKTTTLYSTLAEINVPGVNISTVEDPIEYDLAGVTQIQVKPEIGLTFAAVLRAFLRQDPDVLLVGETRDKDTARTAVEAALTGHLVLTSLQTNSAAAAFTRLGEMGIESFLVSSSTIAVIAQRLVRRLCRACREPYAADSAALAFFGLPAGTELYRGRGCVECSGKGLRGRIGIYEVLRMHAPIRSMVGSGADAQAIHEAGRQHGMIDLKNYAALLLAGGDTTVEEVMNVVSTD